jgi:hypothetical protein
MKKDVIYVDIEDDITSIIEKVKAADSKIVALVPPKRIGALQSAVNLKLLQRAAGTADKRVVLITSDNALAALAGGVAIPVAKNLQSKPEIPQVVAMDEDEEEIINGEEMPIGELAKTAPLAPDPDEIIVPDSISAPTTSSANATRVPNVLGGAAAAAAAKAPRKGPKIPDFDSFRNKLFIGGALGVLLVAFLVWALFFAGKATVAITAKTNAVNIDKVLRLDPNATLDADQGVLKPVTQTVKKTSSVDFDATGKKDVGNKATGTISLSYSQEMQSITVPAGSRFTTATGKQFTSDTTVTVPAPTISGGKIVPGTASVGATAAAIGEEYNVGAQSLTSNDVDVNASFAQATSGGSKSQVTVVSDDDVAKAKDKLSTQNADQIKKDLRAMFKSDSVVINESFKADAANPVSAPNVGEQATRAKLTAETTYTLIGVSRDDLKNIFNAYTNAKLENKSDQKIYEAGDNNVQFSEFQALDGGIFSVKAQATAQVGPKIDEKDLAKQLQGKRSGEIIQLVENIDGVEKVDVKFSPFWVTKAPAAEKIKITFVLKNDKY